MEWWGYLILVLVVLAVVVVSFVAVQARRKSGGVISLDSSKDEGAGS